MELKNAKHGFPIIELSLLKDGLQKGAFPQKVRENSALGKTMSTQPRSKTLGMRAQGPIASQHCVTGGWLQTHTSIGHCCPLQVKGTQTRSSLLVLIQLIQNWGHYNGPHSALWGHTEIPLLEASAGHRLGCFLVALLTGGSFSCVQGRIIKSFSSLSFPSDSLCVILCATSNFSSWNWDPRPQTAVWWDMMCEQQDTFVN